MVGASITDHQCAASSLVQTINQRNCELRLHPVCLTSMGYFLGDLTLSRNCFAFKQACAHYTERSLWKGLIITSHLLCPSNFFLVWLPNHFCLRNWLPGKQKERKKREQQRFSVITRVLGSYWFCRGFQSYHFYRAGPDFTRPSVRPNSSLWLTDFYLSSYSFNDTSSLTITCLFNSPTLTLSLVLLWLMVTFPIYHLVNCFFYLNHRSTLIGARSPAPLFTSITWLFFFSRQAPEKTAQLSGLSLKQEALSCSLWADSLWIQFRPFHSWVQL